MLIMTKNEYLILFENALELAAKNVETMLGHAVPRHFEIEFNGLTPKTRLLTVESALNELYIGPDLFYRIIDMAVRGVSNQHCTVFLSVSGHPPGSFDQTWNQPADSGPFKQVIAGEVERI